MRLFAALFSFLLCASCALAQSAVEPKSFEECLRAPHKLSTDVPPGCVSSSGKVYANTLEKSDDGCVDRCGDDACDETVCMGSGCPCAETHAKCPQDCPPPV
jgi:hypothetical protein